MDNSQQQQDIYQEIQSVISQLVTKLGSSQLNIAKEALKSQVNHPTYIKGRSLVHLICHDFCLYKYPFNKKYKFDYEHLVSMYLESERYEWMMEQIIQKYIKEEWNIEQDDSIKILFILCGAFTTETNNRNRQKKITELRQILYYIFELNSFITKFTRPSFSSQIQYKQTINDVQQKLKTKLPFHFDTDYEDMKNSSKEGFTIKPKKQVFMCSLNFLDIPIISVGEISRKSGDSLLSYEILHLLQCFKESEDALDYINEQLQNVGHEDDNINVQKDLIFFTMSYMQHCAKENYVLIDQQLDEIVEKALKENQMQSVIQSILKTEKKESRENPDLQNSAFSIPSDIKNIKQ